MNKVEKEIIEVVLDDIIPNRFQPRLTFDENSLNELASSIKEHGIIQPLVLRKVGDKYEIIAGERRYKAAYIAGLTKVPAVIIDLNDNESAEVAIVENIQRRDLSPIEEAKSYKKLLDRGYLTQDQLASRMGKAQATVSNKLRLLNLDEEVQDALLNNKISERHARSLLKINDKEKQKELLNEIISKKLNVRDTENLVNEEAKNKDSFAKVSNISNLSNEIKDVDLPAYIGNNQDVSEQKVDTISSFFDGVEDPILKDYSKFHNLHENNIMDASIEISNQKIKPITDFISPIETNIKIDTIEDNDIEVLNDEITPFSTVENKSIEIVIEKINNLLKEIEQIGYKTKLEEYDFEELYQFVIKIDKN